MLSKHVKTPPQTTGWEYKSPLPAVRSSATCYPADKFKELVGSGWKDCRVVSCLTLHREKPLSFPPQDAKAVVDGNVITSQGPGTSLHGTLKKGEKNGVFLSEIIAERKRERERADVAIQCNTVLPNDCAISLTSSKKCQQKEWKSIGFPPSWHDINLARRLQFALKIVEELYGEAKAPTRVFP